MSKLNVYSIGSEEWKQTLQSCEYYDFYHTESYHKLSTSDGEAKLLAYKEGDTIIGLPVVIRKIEGTPYYDVTSVYGYAGPFTNFEISSLDEECLQRFRESVKQYFDTNKIISAFSRLHPLIDSNSVFENFGIVKALNKTVTIDLRIPIDEQRRKFRKSNKSELNQLRRKGYSVKKVETQEELDKFVAIYEETMNRVQAHDSYYFSQEYYQNFFKNDQFDSHILIAIYEDQIIAGAIFTICKNIMQYHLAGTTADFIRVTPMKLVLDEARLLGNELGLDYLHLGGGVGGSDEDSLFRFKSGFSDMYTQFQVWNYIHDKEIYDKLVLENGKESSDSFFPLYRS